MIESAIQLAHIITLLSKPVILLRIQPSLGIRIIQSGLRNLSIEAIYSLSAAVAL